LVALGIGVLCAYTLPAVGGGGEKITLSQLGTLIAMFSDKGWLVDLAKVGVAAAAVSAVAFPRRQRVLQACCISLGALATLPLPIWLNGQLGEEESLGSGLILAVLAFLAAAAIPWIAMAAGQPAGGCGDGRSGTGAGRSSNPAWMGSGLPSQAARIRLTPASGAPGTAVQASLTGFPAGAGIAVQWLATGEALGEATASPAGDASLQFDVPATIGPGTWRVEANAAGARYVGSMFKVTNPVADLAAK
jgi:hypothetical protein